MDRDQLAARLMAMFLVELEEHLGALNDGLMTLERGKDPAGDAETITALFRAAHSLKGAARAVGVAPIEAVCHALEDILSTARDSGDPIAPALFPVLFEAIDAIDEASGRLRASVDLAGGPIERVLPRIEQAARGILPTPGPEPEPEPEPGPEPEMDLALVPEPELPAVAAPIPATANGNGHGKHAANGNGHGNGHASIPANGDGNGHAAGTAPGNGHGATAAAHIAAAPGEAAATHVRVPAEKLDALLSKSGELLVARRATAARAKELAALKASLGRWSDEWRRLAIGIGRAGRGDVRAALAIDRATDRLRRIEKELNRLAAGANDDARRVDRAADGLDREVRRLRMLPFGEACVGIDRAVRDVAARCGKQVELVVEGGDVELDRSVLQGLKDPLLHLVRNAVDHAIEPPDARRAAGKRAQGRVVVSAALHGGQVEVVVDDDGGGLDLEALRARARRNGWPEPADEAEAAQLIFRPGFSTASAVTSVSGRGVGLDVVKDRVEALHGTIDVASTRGIGTRFTLGVPLTLTTLRTVLVEAGGQIFALAGTNVRRLVRIGPGDLKTIRGRPVAFVGGTPWPVASLAATLGLPAREAAPAAAAARPALLVAAGERRVVLIVDALLAEQEVVVKGLGPRIRHVPHVSGATILPSGQIALVLHAAGLIRTALGGAAAAAPLAMPAEEAPKRHRLLVVDDSITTRTLEQAILESAGYEVRTAADGEDGWRSLNEHGADLLVSDVDMPRLDGFGLTEAVRGSARFRDLPVVLVTARATDADRARGAAAGADAYLVKSAFDQGELLAAVSRLL